MIANRRAPISPGAGTAFGEDDAASGRRPHGAPDHQSPYRRSEGFAARALPNEDLAVGYPGALARPSDVCRPRSVALRRRQENSRRRENAFSGCRKDPFRIENITCIREASRDVFARQAWIVRQNVRLAQAIRHQTENEFDQSCVRRSASCDDRKSKDDALLDRRYAYSAATAVGRPCVSTSCSCGSRRRFSARSIRSR